MDLAHEFEFSPHWHIVGYFKLKERSDHFYERTGWTYKNISWEKYHEALDKDSARRTIAYLCTHHRYQKGRQSVTYFGVAAPNKVTCEMTKEMKVAKIDYNLCRKCKNGCVNNRIISKAEPDRIAALCNRTCLTHLEENKLVDNRFENAFRKREAWALDYMENPVKVEG